MTVSRACGWLFLAVASLTLLASVLWADAIVGHFSGPVTITMDEHGIPAERHFQRSLGSGVDELFRLRAGAGIILIMSIIALLLPQRGAAASDAGSTPPPSDQRR